MNAASKRLAKFLGILVVGGLLLYASAPWASVRYKLSVDIDDNGTLYHGSGVLEAHFQSQGPLLIGMSPPWTSSTKGEAFAVDVGRRGTVFVLLIADRKTNQTARWPNNSVDAGRAALEQYLNFNLPSRNSIAGARTIWAFARSKHEADVSAAQLPLLVWFEDPAVPSTAKRIDPDQPDMVLGPGVKIKSAHVEITREPVSRGIDKRLPWLQDDSHDNASGIAEAFHRAEQRRQSGVLKLADAVPNSNKSDRFPWVIDDNAFKEGM